MGVYKRGKVYYMDFMFNGRRIFKSTGKRNKLEAQKAEETERKRLEFEEYASPSQKRAAFTLVKAIDRLWEEKWSKTSRGGELERTRLLKIAEIIGDKTLDLITDDDIEKVKKRLRAEKKSPATINRYMAHLKTLLRTARDKWRIVDFVPYIEVPREKNGRLSTIDEDDEAKLVKYLRDNGKDQYADLVEVLVDTGARLGELLKSTDANVNLKRGELLLFPEITKSSTPRNVPLTDRAAKILAKRVKPGRRLFNFDRWAAGKNFKAARKAVGIKDDQLTLHCLRHTFATRLINNGVDLYTVSKLLGHSNISVTERYSHIATSTLKTAVGVLNRR